MVRRIFAGFIWQAKVRIRINLYKLAASFPSERSTSSADLIALPAGRIAS